MALFGEMSMKTLLNIMWRTTKWQTLVLRMLNTTRCNCKQYRYENSEITVWCLTL